MIPKDQRLIPNNLGGVDNFYDDLPLVGSVEFQDGIIATIPILVLLLLSGAIIPESLQQFRLVLVGIGACISLVALLVKPNYMTLSEFLRLNREYRSSQKEYTKNLNKTIETIKVNEDPDTRNTIGINRIYPEYDVVEREDGTMLSFIKVSGVDLEVLGTRSEKERYAKAFSDVMNGQVDEDIQIFMPMRQYDSTPQVSLIRERSTDPEIKSDALLTKYARGRVNFHQSMAEKAFYRKYYVVIQTKQSEVMSDTQYQQTGVMAVLDSIPGVFGDALKEIYVQLRDVQFGLLSDREIEYQKLTKANEKASKYRGYFDGDRVGGNARVLSGDEIGVVLREFWEGDTIGEERTDGFLREQSYVMGPDKLRQEGDKE